MSACGMPVERQADRLRLELEARGVTGVAVDCPDLTELDEAERDAALDAIVEGRPSPYVLVAGRIVATGSVEIGPVLAALE
jgi:hypothetical protein